MIRGRTLTWLATLLVWVLVIRTRMTAADGVRGSISGRVLFATDNRPAEGVKVDLRRPSFEPVTPVFTRSNGEFEVSGLASPSYLLLVEEQGYEPVQQTVELNLSPGRGLLLYLKKADVERPSPLGHTVSVRELSLSSKAHNAFGMGLERLVKKDPAGSLVHFQRAVAELPSYYEAYHQMGLAYMRLGQAAQAEQAFQKAIDLSQGRYPEALFGLASLLSNHRRFSKAETLVRRGLELDGSSWYGRAGTGPDGGETGGDCPENCRRSAQAQSRLPTAPFVAGQHPHSEARLPRAVGGSGHVPEARAERPNERSGSPDTRESPTGPGQCPQRACHRRSAQSLIRKVSRMRYPDFASAGEGQARSFVTKGWNWGGLVGRRAWEWGQ